MDFNYLRLTGDQGKEIPHGRATNGAELLKEDAEAKLRLLDNIDKKSECDLLFDQYSLVAGSYESVQQRRISNNNVFVFLYSAIIALYNLLSNEHVPLEDTQLSYSIYFIFLLGMIVGFMWIDVNLNLIKSEESKYKLLHMFENHMPLRIYSKPGAIKTSSRRIVSSKNLDLILPIFMTLTLALNFIFMMFNV